MKKWACKKYDIHIVTLVYKQKTIALNTKNKEQNKTLAKQSLKKLQKNCPKM